MKINCIIIDDEPLARKGLTNFILEVGFLHLIGVYSNPLEALPIIQENKIDLVFLDIQMPKMTGIDFLKTIQHPPLTIITTAFPNFALESYELNVIDYLLKPIPIERFVKAVTKAKDYLDLQQHVGKGKQLNEDYFFIKCENRYEKICFNDLLYVEAMQNYVLLHTTQKRFISYLTFKGVEEYLPSDRFHKVHKSYIISILHLETIEGNEVIIGNKRISISRANKDEVLNAILKDRILKR